MDGAIAPADRLRRRCSAGNAARRARSPGSKARRAAPLIGRSIARAEDGEGVDEEVERAFAHARAVPRRAPVARRAKARWPAHGKSAACRRSSRPTAASPAIAGSRCAKALRRHAARHGQLRCSADPDSLRELVHEIKTPLNAIIGFAEIIDGQYLGPADRRYRDRARPKSSPRRKLLLSAIDDLDFAAKLQADRDRPGSGTDLAMLLEQIAAGMRRARRPMAPQLELVDRTTRSAAARSSRRSPNGS